MTSKEMLTGVFMLFVLAALAGCGGSGGNAAAPGPALQAGVIALPKTGQTTCYDAVGTTILCVGTGQDGELRAGVAWPVPRFVVGTGFGTTDQCVTDSLTGLMWVRSSNLIPDTWANALTSANNLTLCGFSDWRLPNRKELRSLIDYSNSNNDVALNIQGFNVQAGYYWSSSSSAGSTTDAWIVGIGSVLDGTVLDGGVLDVNKSNILYFLSVRAGQ